MSSPLTRRRRRPVGGRGERGAATAELALVLPLLVAVTAGLVWVLAVGSAQLRVVDAARETARAIARGDDRAAAADLGRRVAPEGSDIRVTAEGRQVRVEVSGSVPGPGGLLDLLPDARLRATAVAAAEEP